MPAGILPGQPSFHSTSPSTVLTTMLPASLPLPCPTIVLYHNTSDNFNSQVAARVIRFYSCVSQRNRRMEVSRATA